MASAFDHVADTDLRVMEVPVNRLGLGAGTWLRWPELRAFLVAAGHEEVALEIASVADGTAPDVARRAVTIRG